MKKILIMLVLLGLSACVTNKNYRTPSADESAGSGTNSPTAESIQEVAEIRKVSSKADFLDPEEQKNSHREFRSRACGVLSNTEDNRNAIDSKNTIYTINVACEGSSDKVSVYVINRSSLSPNHKGTLTRWMKQSSAVYQNTGKRSKPVVCLDAVADRPVCGEYSILSVKQVKQFSANQSRFSNQSEGMGNL